MMTRSGVCALADQRDLGLGIGIERRSERIDRQESVGLRERGDRARALAGRKGDQTVAARDQRDQHELLAAEFGGDPAPARAR